MTRRFWIALVFSVPVVALEMGAHLAGLSHLVGAQAANWIQFALATPAVIWAGWPLLVRGWASGGIAQPEHVHADRHRHRGRLDLQRRGDIPAGHLSAGIPRRGRLQGAVYFEAASVITVLVLLEPDSPNPGARNAPAARSGPCSIWHRRRPGVSPSAAPMRRLPWMTCKLATVCGFARARKFRSTAR